MMRKINFTKMVASGNDFVVIDNVGQPRHYVGAVRNLYRDRYRAAVPYNVCSLFAKKLCDRKYGVGADGLLLVEKSRKADVKMRIFNADGSEAEMCGNGARCLALYSVREQKTENREQKKIKIETNAGVIEAIVDADNVKIRLTDPKNIKVDIPLKIDNRNIKVNFINTGVPHTVIFVEGLEKIDVFNLGSTVRYHNKFKPSGTNVDFVEVMNKDSISVRTYERGVEDETFACGTGAVAAAIIYVRSRKIETGTWKVYVYTKGGEILKVYFDYRDDKFYNVWLEGKAKIVYRGTVAL